MLRTLFLRLNFQIKSEVRYHIQSNIGFQIYSKSRFLEDTWIGANDLKVQSQWKWVSDNTPISYSNWNRHEPSLTTEHCVHMWRNFEYRWNDHGCSALHGYICETHL